MNIFKFLDDLVTGTIGFLFNFIHTSAVLIRHPFSGSTRLYRRWKSKETDQISGLSYLTLAMAPALVGFSNAGGPIGWVPDSLLFRTADLAATGSGIRDFVPMIGGAIVGAIIASGSFRTLAALRRLRARRRERFAFAMEYQCGLALLTISLAEWISRAAPGWNHPWDWLDQGGVLIYLTMVLLVIHCWTHLIATPSTATRWFRRFLVPARRRRIGRLDAVASVIGPRFAGLPGHVRNPLSVAALLAALVIPPVILMAAIGFGSGASHWLAEQEARSHAAQPNGS